MSLTARSQPPEPAPLTPEPAPLEAPAASTLEAHREAKEDKPSGADADADEVMQEGSTGGPLSPTRSAVARARSPQATTPNPHALKISRDGDGEPAALDGAFDAVE